ncbi:probable LRR receptor-like serine/threonine-protein kinase At3g47570 [Capsicum annuum]|uniref:probable LRR receptor-like serine/threonine-protein kinase At3g47570 n=1 Tax=Capsicum annuum TaxID=4072 RepID=UPI001FB17A7D|nr:probable LRR receptor-like serine/threonine-protein kinase At3g47570 [Capsicum annuum]
MLKKCIVDHSLVLPVEEINVTASLSYEEEPIAILDHQVLKLRSKEIVLIKALWINQKVEEATWESKDDIRARYPHLFDPVDGGVQGSLPPEIGNLKAATQMALSMNQFSNEIPREIGGLQNLAYLSLRHNKLQGPIPDSMSNMTGFEFIDLSHNNMSGITPKSLEKLQNLKYFNISINKFYGEIPSGGPFKNLSSQFFMYNESLCGSSRFSVPPWPTSSKHRSNRKNLLVLFLLLGIALVVVPSTFIFFWIRYRKGKRAPQEADSLSAITRERISYYELLQTTDALSESNLIGSGIFGSVYKGVLRSGITIAVKVFNLQLDVAFKSFDMQRLSIMIDVACALEYLHHGCALLVIHCDVKPSNVFLDEDMVAHLTDFGISKLLGEDESDLHTKMRKPNEFEGDLSLKQWLSYSLPEAVMDVRFQLGNING